MTRLSLALLPLLLTSSLWAQILIQSGTPSTEPFSIGPGTTVSLPSHWRVDKNASAVRTVGTWAAAVLATERSAGNNMSSTASNGIYNYGAGDDATATDRAIGFISSSSGTKSGNLYAWYRNGGTTNISSLTIAYNVEKYRAGSNAAGFAMQLYYSTDGSTWTSAGPGFLTTFAADAANAGFATAPGVTTPVTSSLVVSMAPGADLYLAWNYSVASGTTTTNAQGLGIDDVSITPSGSVGPLPTFVEFQSSASSGSENGGAITIPVTITNPSSTATTTVQVSVSGGSAINGTDYQTFGLTTLTFPAGSSAAQNITITPIDNLVFAGNTTVVLSLSNAGGGTSASLGTKTTHTVTILENEAPPEPDVLVNEYQNTVGDILSSESIELLVKKDHLDMRGYSIADATSGGSYPYGVITLSNHPMWADVPAGTIIVIGGYLTVPFADSVATDGLLLVPTPTTAGGSNQFLSMTPNTIAIAGASDAVAIRNATGTHIHGLAHGTANQTTLPAFQHGWLNNTATIATGASVMFSRTGGAMSILDFTNNSYTVTGTASVGMPNDVDGNREFLRTIRSRTITTNTTLNGTYFWNITLNGGTLTLGGPTTISNLLTINEGSALESGYGLGLVANGNVPNGAGLGNLVIGDNLGTVASLTVAGTLGVSGSLTCPGTEATITYSGTAAQTLVPGQYQNLTLSGGGVAQPKSLLDNASVLGTLTIQSTAMLAADPQKLITLGPTGVYTNSGRFTGRIATTRSVSAYGNQTFGGLGFSTNTSSGTLPGITTLTMTAGQRVWVNNLPSILRQYQVNAQNSAVGPTTVVFTYADDELNGQVESGLGTKFSNDFGTTWIAVPGTLNTSANTISGTASGLHGLWTAHSTVPQGVIATSKDTVKFIAEELGPLPAQGTVTISNANGQGSIIEWNASHTNPLTPPWMRLVPNPTAGINSGILTAEVLRTDLAPGVYQGIITITDPHAANSPKLVQVQYTVMARRTLCVGSDTITLKASYKRTNPTKAVMVLNCGGSFGPGQIAWSVSSTTPWITITQPSGLEGQSFFITASTALKTPGTYVGSVVITGVNSATNDPIHNSPLTVPVTLEVEGSAPVTGSLGSMAAGNTRTLYNALGQKVAILTLSQGSLSSVSITMTPQALPAGYTRMLYVNRYYSISATGTGYIASLTLFYSTNELISSSINPALLRGWRQPYPAGYLWQPTTSISSPPTSSVTITGITDLNGIWAMAAPYLITSLPVRALSPTPSTTGGSLLSWTAESDLHEPGLIIESRNPGSSDWRFVTAVRPAAERSGVISLPPVATTTELHLVGFDQEGKGMESVILTQHPEEVTSVDPLRPGSIRLDPTAPNPVSRSIHHGTKVSFTLDRPRHTELRLVDILGRVHMVRSLGVLDAGSHTIDLPLESIDPGTLYLQILSEGEHRTRPLQVLP